jgi:hypothetical protein
MTAARDRAEAWLRGGLGQMLIGVVENMGWTDGWMGW